MPRVTLDKYGRVFRRLAALSERAFRQFDSRYLRTFAHARRIPPLERRGGGHLSYSDWCFQAGAYAGLVSALSAERTWVLDVGCGRGELVAGILQILPAQAHYLGVDIDATAIQACVRSFDDRRAHFAVVSGGSPFYASVAGHPGSAPLQAHVQQRPWDLVIAKALFDHLTPEDTETYLKLFADNLGVGGRIIATFFVLDSVTLPAPSETGPRFRFGTDHPRVRGFRYSIEHSPIPEAQLGIQERELSRLLDRTDLQVECILPGTWRSGAEHTGLDMPDTLVLRRRAQEHPRRLD